MESDTTVNYGNRTLQKCKSQRSAFRLIASAHIMTVRAEQKHAVGYYFRVKVLPFNSDDDLHADDPTIVPPRCSERSGV